MTGQEYILDLPMCVYNHGRYIAQAIESVVGQVTGFKYRLLIGEDCSTDDSRAIIEKYVSRYPDKIMPFFRSKNIGVVENSKSLLSACTSKYIALCDGDDYWTDPYKLEWQIRFLEENPHFVGCFHNTEERYDDDAEAASFLYCNFPAARPIGFKDLSTGNLMPTCSVVYRNRLFAAFPHWYYTLKMGDWPLHLLNAQFGDYWYIPRVMGVHRLHRSSTWMLQDADKNNQYVIDAFDIMIEGFSASKEHADALIKGRNAFIELARPSPKPATYRERIKARLTGMIQKL